MAEQASSGVNTVPAPSRPYIPDYGIPTTIEGTLPWRHVEERLEKARNYWVVTASADGQPHAVPVWGVWVDGMVCFGGGNVRWTRNLRENPKIAVHLESGDDVVILEGIAEFITDPDPAMIARATEVNQAKYEMDFGAPFWALRPRKAFAWSEFPTNTTRWEFK